MNASLLITLATITLFATLLYPGVRAKPSVDYSAGQPRIQKPKSTPAPLPPDEGRAPVASGVARR